MAINQASQKEEYAKAVCYFLAEQLSIRNIELPRAAEIAQKVTENIRLIETEQDFSRFIKELSGDFEELYMLGDRIEMHIHVSVRKDLEEKVREFVVNILPQDTNLALQILNEAIKDDITVQDLCLKFPQFNHFISKNII